MIKITCPKCGEEITIDKSQYDSLLNDVKGKYGINQSILILLIKISEEYIQQVRMAIF